MLKKIFKKICTKEVILYLIFGVLTTLINIGSFALLKKVFPELDSNIANAIAILLAVLVAYFTNRVWVFHSEAKGFKERFIEFCKFMAGRAFTLVVEWGADFLLFLIPVVKENNNMQVIVKLIVTIIVVILNFFISKYFSFKTKKK